jgi:hypothetical protein
VPYVKQTWADHDPDAPRPAGQKRGEAWMALDETDTLGQRREWYRALVDRRGGPP